MFQTSQFSPKASSSTRRSFVKSSLATTVATVAWPTERLMCAQNPIAPSKRLSAALVGAGGMGSFHAANHLAPYFQIAAVCDVDRTNAEVCNQKHAKGQATITDDYRELLDRDDIDVFFVCTPDHWHTKITVDALRSGKDVYCEKPLTLTIDEGRLIRKTLSETNQILQVGTQQRSDPNFQTAVALARSGRLGPLKRITVAIGGGPAGGPFPASQPPANLDWNRWLGQAPTVEYIPQRCHGNFRWWYEYSGGKMTDWGAHHVDIAYWAIDPDQRSPVTIESIEANLPVPFENGMPTVSHSYNTATSFKVRCQFERDIELIIRDNANDLGFENGLLFECEGGRYFVNRGKLTGKPVEQLQSNPLAEELLAPLRKGREVMNHVVNFYKSCLDRTEPLSDATGHTRSLSICHLANISMRLDRKLRWDPANEQILNDEDANRWQSRPQREGFEVI